MLVYDAEEGVTDSSQSIRKDVERNQPEEAMGPSKRYANFIFRLRGDPTETMDDMREPSLLQQVMAETAGTCLFVIFGLGVNASTIAAGAHSGLLAAAIIWGIAVGFGIISCISVSGGHINPAASLTFALLRPHEFPFYKLIPYCIGQLIGAIIGSLVVYALFNPAIVAFETLNGITRGEEGSEITASIFHGFPPNPGFVGDSTGWTWNTYSSAGAMGVEAVCTGLMMFIVFAITDSRNHLQLGGGTIAFGIGMSVTCIVACFAALDGTSLNPARDLGPRLMTCALGWGEISIPGPPNTSMWGYIIGPLIGGPIGGAFYDLFVMRGL
mmetsp:Transcript_17106/g.29898  ORF Transcript_17106/g.29898 Transcript_17106/m.29898 type:complete len:327 (-) Transcript_17106:540-1520(-)|eukprot:CAMPEP_0171500340 /NCGR_PEP_ID=MMETSP0958-20121227/8935_1 /TAXON_ID=87120 /ORGANISM="Aurantiochytrium limacinum, Strain ATCCMYA-1381" /LENGTH=326 /DNA_ID=CAMNT_0012035007 /DNA_START=155 /DNA_END=1135 /DNA_ORIENTATION=-